MSVGKVYTTTIEVFGRDGIYRLSILATLAIAKFNVFNGGFSRLVITPRATPHNFHTDLNDFVSVGFQFVHILDRKSVV